MGTHCNAKLVIISLSLYISGTKDLNAGRHLLAAVSDLDFLCDEPETQMCREENDIVDGVSGLLV